MSSPASLTLSRLLTDNPAVDLMARLTYPKKIQVVGLVAGIAILLLTGQLFFSLSGQIERARLERSGLYLVVPVRQILEPLQEHRGLAHAYLSGDEEFRATQGPRLQRLLDERRASVDAAIGAAENAFQTHLPALLQDRRWQEFRHSWRAAAQGSDLEPRASLERHNQLVAQLNALISAAADATHLSVDPYVGTFYLAQMVTQNLPAVLEQMARIRDMGTGFYASHYIDRDDKHLLISLNTMTAASLDGLRQTVQDKVLPTMPELGKELTPRLQEMTQVAGSVDAFTQMKLMGMLFDSSPTAFFGAMSYGDTSRLGAYDVGPRDTSLDTGEPIAPGPIGRVYGTLDQFTRILDVTIEQRLWVLYQQLALNLIVAATALIIVIYMLWLMYVAFPIRKLISATELVAGGDLTVKLEVDRNDEIGQLSRAFNTMTEAVRYARDNLEQQVAERTADLAAKNELIMDSINYARVIQQSYLRSSQADMASTLADCAMVWEPRDVVGGDYLYFRRFADGYFFALIDCTGHGVPGAFMTLIMASYLNNLLTQANRHDPAGLLARMNQAVKGALGQTGTGVAAPEHASDDGMDAAFCWVDSQHQQLTYAGARTPLYLLPPDAPEVLQYDGERMGVGYVATPMDFAWRNQVIELQPGSIVCVSTDGLVDQVGEARRMAFGKKRLKQQMLYNRGLAVPELQAEIMAELHAWQGKESRRDDICLFTFRHQPPGDCP